MKSNRLSKNPYFTWGCSDDLAYRLKKTLYYSEDDDCYGSTSSAALTDVAVSILKETSKKSRRKLSQRYASSLTRHLSISPCSLMLSILYAERLRQINSSYLEKVSSSDLYVVSMLVATKFLHDEGEQEEIYNDEWAEAAGLAVSTVNRLEREFLDAIDWKIYVSPEEFLELCSMIETKIALKLGLQRGWFSYTDLTQCLLEVNYQNILKGILEKTVKVIGGLTLVYGVTLSLMASTIITFAAMSNANHIKTGNSCAGQLRNKTNVTTKSSDTTISMDTQYTEHLLTRKRTNLMVLDKTELTSDVIHKEFNTSLRNCTGKDSTPRSTQLHHYGRKSYGDSHVYIEYRYQNSYRQTNLFYAYDTIDFYLFSDKEDVYKGLNSDTEQMHGKSNNPPLSNLMVESGKKWYGLSGYHTRILGMVVM